MSLLRHFHYYESSTGVFHPKTVSTNHYDERDVQRFVRANAPMGHSHIEGRFDHLSQRVNIHTGEVEDYQPPKPSEDHEWDERARRWALKPHVPRPKDALQRLEELEREVAALKATLGR